MERIVEFSPAYEWGSGMSWRNTTVRYSILIRAEGPKGPIYIIRTSYPTIYTLYS